MYVKPPISTKKLESLIPKFQLHLSSILDAIYDQNVNVAGYTQWSLMDNFEWSNGYTAKFGAVSVDFASENRTRTPKESFYWYQEVIRNRCLDGPCIDDVSAVTNRSPQLFVISIALIMLKLLYWLTPFTRPAIWTCNKKYRIWMWIWVF